MSKKKFIRVSDHADRTVVRVLAKSPAQALRYAKSLLSAEETEPSEVISLVQRGVAITELDDDGNAILPEPQDAGPTSPLV